MTFAESSKQLLELFKPKLSSVFNVNFYSSLSSFIIWNILLDSNGNGIHQIQRAQRLLDRNGTQNCNSVQLSLPGEADLEPSRSSKSKLNSQEHHFFCSIIKGHLYLPIRSRPNLTFSVYESSRSLNTPTSRHLGIAKQNLRHVHGNMGFGIPFPSKPSYFFSQFSRIRWCWMGGCETNQKSTIGFIFTINRAAVYRKSNRQPIARCPLECLNKRHLPVEDKI